MRENEFRKALDECLERIRQGDTVQACLAANPEHAAQLAPFLNSAAIMRKLEPPQPSAEDDQQMPAIDCWRGWRKVVERGQ